ncbi:hypothetical protein Psfp_03046 [Pelotomaculum sp. FP]|nr:hypothetical protein Psfp_03046 [Pelotomaculum sp. FP]
MSDIYIFSGKVLPERANVQFASPLILEVKYNDFDFKVIINIILSQISAKVEILRGNPDIGTMKNYLESTVRSLVDGLGYLLACGYDVEITSVMLPDSSMIVFGVGVTELEKEKDTRNFSNAELFKILFSGKPKTDYLRRALGDLRETIRSPHDTALFAYRAIESIRESFRISDSEDKNILWQRMRESLSIEKEYIMFIEKYRTIEAHGKTLPVSGDDRVEIMRRAWRIVERFCNYLLKGESDLPINDFPILK